MLSKTLDAVRQWVADNDCSSFWLDNGEKVCSTHNYCYSQTLPPDCNGAPEELPLIRTLIQLLDQEYPACSTQFTEAPVEKSLDTNPHNMKEKPL